MSQSPLSESTNLNTIEELFARFDALNGEMTEDEIEQMVQVCRRAREQWIVEEKAPPKPRGRPKGPNPLDALEID